jgi:hypothetical protein
VTPSLPPSVVFLQSEGTPADFEEFWRKDPIGAAQFATGMAMAQQAPFEGLEELKALLEEGAEDLEQQKAKLQQFAARSPDVFKFVESSEAARRGRAEGIGWTTS